MSTLTIDIPGCLWFTTNQRIHWTKRAKLTGQLRELAGWEARAMLNQHDKARITAIVSRPDARRFDPHNVVGTVIKALIDGLVDAGVLPDDDAKHLTGLEVRCGEPTRKPGLYQVRLEIEPCD